MRDWLAYPGDKGLAVTQVLYDGIESIVTGEEDDMKALQSDLAAEIGDMLPR